MKRNFQLFLIFLGLLGVVGLAHNAYSQNAFDVSLVSQTSVFDWEDANHNDGRGNFPFFNIEYLPSGQFVVAGNCADGSGESGFEEGGMWLLSEAGQFLGSRDVCYDSSVRAEACYEGQGCFTGYKILPTSNGEFIRELDPTGPGFARPPILYRASQSGFNLIERLWYNDRDFDRGDISETRNFAYANGVMIGVEERYREGQRLAIYDTPSFSKLSDFPVGYYPIGGVGEYFLARPTSNQFHIDVYRMPSEDEILRGERPQKVQEFDDNFYPLFIYDTANRNRVGLVVSEGRSSSRGYVEVYESGADGLNLIRTFGTIDIRLLSGLSGITAGHASTIALSGDYLASASCSSGNDCRLEVRNGDQELNVEPFPVEGGVNIYSVSMSPNGSILVSTDIRQDAGGDLFLYRIGGAPGTAPPPGTVPPGGDGGNSITPEQENQFLYDLGRIFTSGILRFLSGGGPLASESSNSVVSSGQCPPRTEEEIRSFQCTQGIVCSGDKETTGYGNLGPQTRAAIQEAYPATLRAACAIEVSTYSPQNSAGGDEEGVDSPNGQGPQVEGASINLAGSNALSAIKVVLNDIASMAESLQQKIQSLTN